MRCFHLLPLLSIIAAASASAQTTPSSSMGPSSSVGPSPSLGLGGPVVAGVCLLSREAVFANAKVGLAASARLKVLSDQAQAEIDGQRKPIDVDVKAFQADSPKLSPDQRALREQTLSTRLQPVQALAAQRSREIDATRTKAMQQISTQLQPAVATVYKQHGCGLLLDRNGVIAGNFTNDLTPDVVKALDAKVTTMTFERETLPSAATTPPLRR